MSLVLCCSTLFSIIISEIIKNFNTIPKLKTKIKIIKIINIYLKIKQIKSINLIQIYCNCKIFFSG